MTFFCCIKFFSVIFIQLLYNFRITLFEMNCIELITCIWGVLQSSPARTALATYGCHVQYYERQSKLEVEINRVECTYLTKRRESSYF